MSISSDEINYLIYRYLQENGYTHSAFSFAYESLVARSSVAQADVPPGTLIALLQKGLEYTAIEEHISEDGSVKEFDDNFSLLSPFIFEALTTKEEKKLRRPASTNQSTLQENTAMTEDNNGEGVNGEGSSGNSIPITIQPSTVSLKFDTENRWLQLLGHQGEVFMCVWNPVQRQLASGSADGMCRLWGLWEMDSEKWTSKESEINLRTSIMQHSQYPGERFKDVTSVTWSPDGKYLATGCYDGMARIWDNTGTLKAQLKEHSGPVFSLKWNKQGNYILSGSYDRRAIVWNAETGKVVKSFMLHSAPVLDVDWKDGDTFATCSSDMSIHVCKVSSSDSSSYRTLLGHKDEVNAVCWSPGGAFVASCSDDSTAKIWSIDQGLIHDLKGHLKEIYTVRWTPTGPGSNHPNKPLLLCTASFDGTVKVWNATTGLIEQNLYKQAQPVYSIAPSPNGEYLATGSLGGHVSVWSLKDGSLIREVHGSGDTFDVSWSHDGTMLCSCFSSGSLHVLDVTSQAHLPTITTTSTSTTINHSTDIKPLESKKITNSNKIESSQHMTTEAVVDTAHTSSSSSIIETETQKERQKSVEDMMVEEEPQSQSQSKSNEIVSKSKSMMVDDTDTNIEEGNDNSGGDGGSENDEATVVVSVPVSVTQIIHLNGKHTPDLMKTDELVGNSNHSNGNNNSNNNSTSSSNSNNSSDVETNDMDIDSSDMIDNESMSTG